MELKRKAIICGVEKKGLWNLLLDVTFDEYSMINHREDSINLVGKHDQGASLKVKFVT